MTGTIRGTPTMRYLRLVGVGVAVGIALVALVAWDSIWPSWTGLRGRTLWDLADLFIIPISLAVIGYLFSNAQRRQERALAETERATDREIARTREQHAALQAYLSAITELLVSGNMQEDAFRPLARSRTLVILESLDSSGKRDVVRFLKEAGLIAVSNPRVDLHGADLSDADLSGLDLSGSCLAGAKLSKGNLVSASLWGSTLAHADLTGTDLSAAGLVQTVLGSALIDEGTTFDRCNLIMADFRDLTTIAPTMMPGVAERRREARQKEWVAALASASWRGASYDFSTQWPEGFRAEEFGANNVSD
jgi:uncharacterized protein YjbI with pentapeptide repeats